VRERRLGVVLKAPQIAWFDVAGVVAVEQQVEEADEVPVRLVLQGSSKRTGLIFFDLADPSQIPVIAEPFFMTVNAAIELLPVMTPEDVQKGLEEAAKAF
jgi:hypothetical protein